MSTMWFFNDINLFSMLCPHRFEQFKGKHSFYNYKKGDYVYFEEESSTKLFLIETGKVKIGYYDETGQEFIKIILAKGEIFGEKAFLGEEKRNEFAQSIEENTSICPVNIDTIQTLLKENSDFSLRIYKFIGFRFKKLERRLQILLFKDIKTRLIEFINDLSDEYGFDNNKNGITIKHPYTQKDIAALIGTSRPTINLFLNELKTEGILDFNRKEIVLKKIAKV